MTIQFTARHAKVNPRIQQFAEEAVRSLDTLYDGIVSADVVVDDGEGGGHVKKAEISIRVYRENLFASDTTDDMNRSIQSCIDKLQRQLVKYKAKLRTGRRPHDQPEIAPGDDLL